MIIYYLPIAPLSSPLYLTPWVPDADELNLFASIINLKDKKQPWVVGVAFNLLCWLSQLSPVTYLFCTSDRVGVSFDKFESCHCFCLIGTGDLEASK